MKSLVFRASGSGDPVLVLASGADRVDEGLLAEAVGEPIGKADPDFVRERTGFAIGGVPPVGHAQPIVDVRGGTVARARSGVGSRGHTARGVRPGVARTSWCALRARGLSLLR